MSPLFDGSAIIVRGYDSLEFLFLLYCILSFGESTQVLVLIPFRQKVNPDESGK